MKAVRITIDLNNPNGKPYFEFWEVTKITENYVHAKSVIGWFTQGRRIYKNSLDQIHYPKKLTYTYDFTTEIEDYLEIEESEKTQKIMREMRNKIKLELEYYQRHLEGIYKYYTRNLKVNENE
jgi:hypothetical protein